MKKKFSIFLLSNTASAFIAMFYIFASRHSSILFGEPEFPKDLLE